MIDRMTAETLVACPLEKLKSLQHEYTVALKARETLEAISRVIHQAGGGISAEGVSTTKVGDLALTMARNNIVLSVKYVGEATAMSQKPDGNTGPDDIDEWVSASKYPLKPVAVGSVIHTNGYCDTCGEMYVKGYEKNHPTCRRSTLTVPPENDHSH